ncbi:Protein of unknown function [Gryllus bimaculatus]|nr:Protein of unknown function [Gryllus bimaculatus]
MRSPRRATVILTLVLTVCCEVSHLAAPGFAQVGGGFKYSAATASGSTNVLPHLLPEETEIVD